MRFTERELTVAVDELAQEAAREAPTGGATRSRWRRRPRDVDWHAMPPMEKYHLRTAVADSVLPVLLDLPERPTIGRAPEFTDQEWLAAATSGLQRTLEGREDAPTTLPEDQRAALLAGMVELGRAAIAAMPVRQDPDALVIPDHL